MHLQLLAGFPMCYDIYGSVFFHMKEVIITTMKKTSKHLTKEDRISIERMLTKGWKVSEIARRIGKCRTTVSREIEKRRIPRNVKPGNRCVHRHTCDLPSSCNQPTCIRRNQSCRSLCNGCNIRCDKFQEDLCRTTTRAPFVCNACDIRTRCKLRGFLYDATEAQEAYKKTLSASRTGISLSEEQLEAMDELVTPLIQQGQSVNVVFENHRDELPITARTAYDYIDSGLLGAKNLDLARKVRRSYRKKSGPVLRVDKACHQGRSYEDYLAFMGAHPDMNVVEGDSVIGKKGGKVLLTLMFTNCDLQMAFLRDRNNAATVSAVFESLRTILGIPLFKELFQVILVDRGSEFTDPVKIEFDPETGEQLCHVFYCDPQNSNQKSHCERNHQFIRYFIPKGKSMDDLTPEKVTLMMNHINSYPRKKWNGRSPLEVFTSIYGEEVPHFLSMKQIAADSIKLKPELIK